MAKTRSSKHLYLRNQRNWYCSPLDQLNQRIVPSLVWKPTRQNSDLPVPMMRGILIGWLIEVCYKFEPMDETLYLMVNLIDRFLALKPVRFLKAAQSDKKLELLSFFIVELCLFENVTRLVIQIEY
ncbi:Cyclin-B2-3 [Vitis vinifera]|uniref:Cyclin-B2-3 n=1 Tax=Vitis vinifera TaxID=29760 RepID=A0A438H2I8_VITVI|nr:Cyclin-B2-3 [Vitis vinifera]